ncbi:MAG: AIR synthase related protein, partial [Candidatus Pacebacteria bacterium]|nr:AIR synthase related protein [Candidatus Paceibacterota bacterium]
MNYRIEVSFKERVNDSAGQALEKRIAEDLGVQAGKVKTSDVYTIEGDLQNEQVSLLAGSLFIDPIIQEAAIGRPFHTGADWVVEVGFKPGVTDNVGKTARAAIEDVLGEKIDGLAVYTSKKYFIWGKGLSRAGLENVTRNFLANEQIQRWLISDILASDQNLPMPKVSIPRAPAVGEIDLKVSDEELQKISKTRKLALNLGEMRMIRDYFSDPKVVEERQKQGLGAKPTDAELEVLAQTWSEHCKHKIFNAKISYNDGRSEKTVESLFSTFIKSSTEKLKQESDWVVSTLWDNSGVMKFNDGWLFCFKGETHNSPSNEEPYGGAVTGIVGVYRDPMGTGRGAKIIYATYGFCTGNPFYNGDLKPKIHPKRLLEGVRQGVQDGGNKHGVPTVYGFTFFDDGFMGKPAIYVLAAGIIPAKVNGQLGHLKVTNPGDLIVMAGGRVGIDG